jgi:hypothetical protein
MTRPLDYRQMKPGEPELKGLERQMSLLTAGASHPMPNPSPKAPLEEQNAWADQVVHQVAEGMRKRPADYIPKY